MTNTTFLLLQLIAHLLADYTFQSQKWCDQKKKHVINHVHLLHTLIVFLCSWVLSFDWQFWIYALSIAIIHLAIDCLKSLWDQTNPEPKTDSLLVRAGFFIDQIFHIFTFLGFTYLYLNKANPAPMVVFEERTIALFAAFLISTKPANILIQNLFAAFEIPIADSEKKNEAELQNAGKLIGIAERFLALILILHQQFAALGLIIAAKSILRFKSTMRNEYILVGTLLSFGIALLLGVTILNIWPNSMTQ